MISRCKYKKLKYIVEDNEIGIFDKTDSLFLLFNFVYNFIVNLKPILIQALFLANNRFVCPNLQHKIEL